MSEHTKIQWCDHTFNPWIGCAKVSPGCANCYAEVSTPSRTRGIAWGKGQPRQRTSASNWNEPVRWNNKPFICDECGEAQADNGYPPGCPNCGNSKWHRARVFCASLADWLDDEVPIEWLADLLKLIHDTPNLDWLLLTKRPENFFDRVGRCIDSERRMMWFDEGTPPRNVWIGTTVEDQQRADERIPELLKIPARVRFLSVEPMLGPIDFTSHFLRARGGLHWAIFGGESGRNARPCNVGWIRAAGTQCRMYRVAPFVKQLGADVRDVWPNQKGWPLSVLFNSHVLTRAMLKHPKGGDPEEWPEDLRVREFPNNQHGRN